MFACAIMVAAPQVGQEDATMLVTAVQGFGCRQSQHMQARRSALLPSPSLSFGFFRALDVMLPSYRLYFQFLIRGY